MKCKRCQTDNLTIARYCCNCGKPFTEEEREAAYAETPFGKLDKARKLKSILTLDIITGSLWYKVLILAAILALGIYLRISGVKPFRLEASEDYELKYLKSAQTYYVITDAEKADLRLVVPKGTDQLIVEELDAEGQTVNQTAVPAESGISLPVSGEVHYRLSTQKAEKTTNDLTLYVYRTRAQEVSDGNQ